MKKKLLIEVGDDIDLDFLQKNCKTGGPIVDPVPECRAIAEGKVLSDMTNGDVIMATGLVEIVGNLSNDMRVCVSVNGLINLEFVSFSKAWWDAPYESEVN